MHIMKLPKDKDWRRRPLGDDLDVGENGEKMWAKIDWEGSIRGDMKLEDEGGGVVLEKDTMRRGEKWWCTQFLLPGIRK